MPIKVLSDLVVAQIAAGEVVERPASVVKELLENALDAGATHIQVSTVDGGRRMLRISDNGSGIREAEIELAFARHATSKLQRAEDLEHLHTLGFRGEALCSIAAVSQVTCITRHQDEAHGTKIVIEGGQVISKQVTGAPSGTILTIENLFYNVPARLKFLKKDATEKRQIAHVVTMMAMAYPHVRFILEQDNRESFRSAGTGNLEDVLVAAYGVEDVRQMLPVKFSAGGIHIGGYTSSEALWRTDRSRINVFINGRVVQDNNLTYAVTQAYQTIFQQGQYPVSVLSLEMPPEDVDVNVHPTKAEVRFRDPSTIFAAVQRAVRETIVGTQGLPLISSDGPRGFSNFPAARQQPITNLLDTTSDYTPPPPRIDTSAASDTDDYAHIPEGHGQPENPRTLPMLRVVGQVGARYIIAEGPAGVYLVDQHNAHARVLYAQIKQQMAHEGIRQTDDITGTVTFSTTQAALFEQGALILKTLGIEIELFGPNTFRTLAAPAMLEGIDTQTLLTALLPEFQNPDPQEAMLRSLCRLAAVRAGQVLSTEQMQALIRQLERTPDPFTSPDGSQTVLHFSSDQLMREFRAR